MYKIVEVKRLQINKKETEEWTYQVILIFALCMYVAVAFSKEIKFSCDLNFRQKKNKRDIWKLFPLHHNNRNFLLFLGAT